VPCLLVVWPARAGDWVRCRAAARKEEDEGTREPRPWPMAPRCARREWRGTTNRLPPTRKKAKSKVRERRRELTSSDEQ
jgi:hypothetical protein